MSDLGVAPEPAPPPAPPRRSGGQALFGFLLVVALVFATRTLGWWQEGELLAGDHADGAIRFAIQVDRMSPGAFPGDLAVRSSEGLGIYEYFFQLVIGFARVTGWSLLTANVVLCWVGNGLYLAGVAVLLWRLRPSVGVVVLGTLLAAQPFVLISMSTGVVHSLAIPREVWLWPLPWFACWFAWRPRDGWETVGFYGALGAAYGLTYPLWAVLLGLGFGLADAGRLVRERRYAGLAWLALGGALCAAMVALPALGVARTVAGSESALLDYNEITRSVFRTKGFRRLAIFAVVGWVALRSTVRRGVEPLGPVSRLQGLLLASLGVCLLYEPFERWFPKLSLLYLGRLSLVAYLVSMVGVAIWLHDRWRGWPVAGRALAVIGLALLLLDPLRHTVRSWRQPSAPLQSDFVSFCRAATRHVPVDGLCIVPPDTGTHYFRVYAQRGLWIHRKDTGVLSRSRELYREAGRRVELVEAFYDESTSASARAELLQRLQAEGVTHVVTKANTAWSADLAWPPVLSQGVWQLRTPASPP